MRSKTLIAIGLIGAAAVACSGGVSLGDLDGGAPTPTATPDAGAIGPVTPDAAIAVCSSTDQCGPAPPPYATTCSDGTTGGPTGRCIQSDGGACAWEIRFCPAPATCFDAKGNLDPSLTTCASPADCTIVKYAADCCGSQRYAGAATASQSPVKTCVDERNTTLPLCDCAAHSTTADDGSTTSQSTTLPNVTCNPSGHCVTSYNPIP